MNDEILHGHEPDMPFELEYVLFSCLKTTQEIIGQPGLDKYKNSEDMGLKIAPIEVLPTDGCNYLIHDGNHRARDQYDKDQSGLWAYVLLDRNQTMEGEGRYIEDVPIVPYEVGESPSPYKNRTLM